MASLLWISLVNPLPFSSPYFTSPKKKKQTYFQFFFFLLFSHKSQHLISSLYYINNFLLQLTTKKIPLLIYLTDMPVEYKNLTKCYIRLSEEHEVLHERGKKRSIL